MRPEIADHGPATWTDQRPQDIAHRGGERAMTTLDLEPIKERLAAATPGPWGDLLQAQPGQARMGNPNSHPRSWNG